PADMAFPDLRGRDQELPRPDDPIAGIWLDLHDPADHHRVPGGLLDRIPWRHPQVALPVLVAVAVLCVVRAPGTVVAVHAPRRWIHRGNAARLGSRGPGIPHLGDNARGDRRSHI